MFPTVHGNDEVKRGIMLMLFGGVPKTTLEGTTLRSVSSCCFTIPASVSDSKNRNVLILILISNLILIRS